MSSPPTSMTSDIEDDHCTLGKHKMLFAGCQVRV